MTKISGQFCCHIADNIPFKIQLARRVTCSSGLIVIYKISPKFPWNFDTQDLSQFTKEKHKSVVNLIITYVVVRQSSLKWLKILFFYYNL